jgi:maltose O-acetyltransferase
MFKEVGLKRLIKYFFTELWYGIFLLLPYSPVRIWWLKLGGAKIGQNCFVDRIFLMNLDRTGLAGLTVGNNCYLGPLVLLDLAGKISLGEQVTISAKATILSHHSVGWGSHPLLRFYPKRVELTRLESGVVIGVGAVVLPGVVIGRHSLVAAGAVVNANLPAQVMAAGLPAKIKKQLK